MTEIETRFATHIDVGLDRVEDDEFDLDLRLGELGPWRSGHAVLPLVDGQSDGAGCLPTGGQGAGGTCGTDNNTCPGTCAGRDTCPHTACGNTCQATCAGLHTCPHTDCGNTCHATCVGATCGNTCPHTECNTCGHTECVNTCVGQHCPQTGNVNCHPL